MSGKPVRVSFVTTLPDSDDGALVQAVLLRGIRLACEHAGVPLGHLAVHDAASYDEQHEAGKR